MRKSRLSLSKIEKILIALGCFCAVIAITGIALLIFYPDTGSKIEEPKDGNEAEGQAELPKTEDAFLNDITSILPDYCNLNEVIPDIEFTDDNGEKVSVKDFTGKVTILTFWASWCPDCKQELPLVNEFLEISRKYGDINYILINKLDNDKETKEKALNYLSEEGITIKTYYDEGLAAYQKLGLHNIPTTLFLDEKGIIRAWSPRQINDTRVFEAYLANTVEGSGKITGNFVTSNMMDDGGGIHTIYDISGRKTLESDILSESQGTMLEYAVLRQDRVLYDKLLSYVETVMIKDGLSSWKVSAGKTSPVNALIDDFRIFDSLLLAQQLWGDYEKNLDRYVTAFSKYAVRNGRYVDFYDRDAKQYAKRFTLCYGDLKVMSALAERNTDLKESYENALKLVTEGKISDRFPLYYSWYNYKTNTYEKDELNSAEAMVTLLHLAEADLLTENSINWLKEQLDKEGVKARYNIQGEVVEGYNYDSTAVYALIAMIADEIGDKELQGKALKKMEKMRIVNLAYNYNGAFGMEDGSGITSFDQIMAMLAYEYTK